MAIFTCLSEMETRRNHAELGNCDFNGYIEDYLLFMEDSEMPKEFKGFLSALVEADASIKICVNVGLNINPKVVTNRIIRYKDAFKLPKGRLEFPYIIYGKNSYGEDRAVIFELGNQAAYVKAKGLYYCLTEPMGIVENARNEIVAMSISDFDAALSIFQSMFIRADKTGTVQRRLDKDMFASYEVLKTYCLDYAKELKETLEQRIKACSGKEKDAESKEFIIYETIMMWFLIKKVLYVQYMMNKQILSDLHNNDIKDQRSFAKKYADEVPFVSYSEMWKL